MNAICVFLLVYLTVTVESRCPKQDTLITEDRKCKISCENNGDCSATNKECLCDGECGMSCFNPSAECLEPEHIPNGSYKTNTLSIQGKAIYTCNRGYVLIGRNKRICRADKKWHGSLPACKKGCLNPPQVENAYPNTAKHTFEIDEEVTYLCRTGYYIEERSIARTTCQSDGTWTVTTFHCNIQICDELYPIRNGEITINRDKNYFGSTATLKCNPGYDSFPRGANIRCFAGSVDNSPYGKWTGSLPSCDIKSCPPPKNPTNGEVVERRWIVLEFGNKISYTCDVGYKIEGESIGQCDDLETWGIMPNCIVDPNCDFNDISSPLCGYTTRENEWDRYSTTENNGFPGYVSRARYEGSKLISPEIAADWSSYQFICLKFNYYLHPVGSLAIKSTWDFNDPRISWNTNKNEASHTWLDAILNIETTTSIKYQFNAENPIVYLDNVQVQEEKCVEHCSSFPCKNDGSCVNRMQTYTCFCTIDFKGPTCDTAITCKNPPFQSNQNAIGDKSAWRVDETVEIECNDGYAFESPNPQTTFTCGNEEQWLGTITTCHDVKCKDPNKFITNGKRTDTSWNWFLTPRDTASYECSDNYKMYGLEGIQKRRTITCRGTSWFSRSWWDPDPSKIRCVEIECTSPQLRSHQTLDNKTSKWKVNSVAIYRCDPGYEFSSGVKTRNIRCKSNEAWTSADDDDECVKTADENTTTPDIVYSSTSKTTTAQPKEVIITQQPPQSSSTTTETELGCQSPNLPDHSHIINDPASYPIRQRFHLKCKEDYELVGKNFIKCKSDQTWTRTNAKCKANTCLLDKYFMPDELYVEGFSAGTLYKEKFANGREVTLSCDGKMVPIQVTQETYTTPTSTCQLGGRWSPYIEDFHCVVACYSPPEPTNGHWIQDPKRNIFKALEKISFNCADGYKYGQNVHYVECKDNGLWRVPENACKKK